MVQFSLQSQQRLFQPKMSDVSAEICSLITRDQLSETFAGVDAKNNICLDSCSLRTKEKKAATTITISLERCVLLPELHTTRPGELSPLTETTN